MSRTRPPLDAREQLALRELIDLLDRTPPLALAQANDLYAAHSRRIFGALVNSDKTLGEVQDSVLRPYYSASDPKAAIRAVNDDLLEQIRIVRGRFVEWISTGDYVPPSFAWRITVILRKAKDYPMESAFLRAYCKHFYGELGNMEAKISARHRTVNGSSP